jgi:hypothetical protein
MVNTKCLGGVISKVIRARQTAFNGDRQIMDGKVAANEIIDDERRQRRRCVKLNRLRVGLA